MQIIGMPDGETNTEIIAEFISGGLTEFRTAVVEIQISLPPVLSIAKDAEGQQAQCNYNFLHIFYSIFKWCNVSFYRTGRTEFLHVLHGAVVKE